jgi:hypothetical protein
MALTLFFSPAARILRQPLSQQLIWSEVRCFMKVSVNLQNLTNTVGNFYGLERV